MNKFKIGHKSMAAGWGLEKTGQQCSILFSLILIYNYMYSNAWYYNGLEC